MISFFIMDPTTVAIISIVVAAASEIIGLNPRWKANSVLQVVVQVLRKIFPR